MSGKWLSGVLAAIALAASAMPSQAFTPLPPQIVIESGVTNAQYAPRRGYYRYGDYYYYNGYRGYRYQRPGYRYHRGWWYPRAAFGIVIERRPAYRPRSAMVAGMSIGAIIAIAPTGHTTTAISPLTARVGSAIRPIVEQTGWSAMRKSVRGFRLHLTPSPSSSGR